MSLLAFSQLSETTEKVSEIAIKSPELFAEGQFYTAEGRIYRAYRQKRGWMLMDVNKSFRSGHVMVVNGLFERSGIFYSGEYIHNGSGTWWQGKPVKTAISPSVMTLCGVITKKINLDWKQG